MIKNCPNGLNVYKNITEVNIAATFIRRLLLNFGLITVLHFVANYLFTMPTMCVWNLCTSNINLDMIDVVSTQFCLNVVTEQNSPLCQEDTAYLSRSIRFVCNMF